jgi:hypothetical protein
MGSARLSSTVLKALYDDATHGMTAGQAAKKNGLLETTGIVAMKRLRQYIAAISDGSIAKWNKRATAYVITAKWAIKQDAIVFTPKPVETTLSPTPGPTIAEVKLPQEVSERFAKLDLGYKFFLDQVETFIKAEVESRVHDIIEENGNLKKLMDNARFGNWTEGLKKHFEEK